MNKQNKVNPLAVTNLPDVVEEIIEDYLREWLPVVEFKDCTTFAVSSDSKFVILGFDDGKVTKLSLESLKIQDLCKCDDPVSHIVISNDNKYVVVISQLSFRIINFEARTEFIVRKAHFDVITGVNISKDSTFFVTCSLQDEKIKIWDFKTGKLKKTIEAKDWLCSIALSRDGNYIITGGYSLGRIDYWSRKHGTVIKKINTDYDYQSIGQLLVSPDGKFIISNSNSKAKIFNYETGLELVNNIFPQDSIGSIYFVDNENLLCSLNTSCTIILYNIKSGKHKVILKNALPMAPVAISPDKKFIIVSEYIKTTDIAGNCEYEKTVKILKEFVFGQIPEPAQEKKSDEKKEN